MSTLLKKQIEEKSIVWFQQTNQYLILENLAADIVEMILFGGSIDEASSYLQNYIDVSDRDAKKFVTDLKIGVIDPNSDSLQKKALKKSDEKPLSYEFIKFYKIKNKLIKICYEGELELYLIHPKFAHLEVSISNNYDVIFETFTREGFTFLFLNNVLINSWEEENIHYFQGKFSMKIVECIYENTEKDWLGVFHASAIGKKDRSILVLGDSGNGKSTSLSLLQAHGFDCIADDFVPVDKNANVRGFPAGISIKRNSLDVLLPLYPQLKTSAEFHYKRLNKIVRYLPPSKIEYDQKYPCNALVFIKYDSKIEFEINPISNLVAFEKLIPDSWISQEFENVSTFLSWFENLPCYQLTYSNNQKMIKAIDNLL